jgi:hypothetical protein
MKLFLTAFFIFFSLLTTVLENGDHRFCEKESSTISVISSSNSHHHQCANEHQTNCNDSNCFGSAHFGHGYYDKPNDIAGLSSLNGIPLLQTFSSFNHHSLVYLDSIFRPPLA